MKNRAVVPPTEGLANRIQRAVCHLTREIHRDLPREGNISWTTLAGQIGDSDIVVVCDDLLDDFNIDRGPILLMKNIAEQVLDHGCGERLFGERAVGRNADVGTFQTANVGSNSFRDELPPYFPRLCSFP